MTDHTSHVFRESNANRDNVQRLLLSRGFNSINRMCSIAIRTHGSIIELGVDTSATGSREDDAVDATRNKQRMAQYKRTRMKSKVDCTSEVGQFEQGLSTHA